MNHLADLLEGMRSIYLRWLDDAFDDLHRKKIKYFAEFAMQDDSGFCREGPLSLGFRCDALVLSADEKNATPTFFPAERRLNFAPTEFESGGVKISLASCHWEAVRLAVLGDPTRTADALKAWFESAFIPAEKRGQDEIQNVIHDLSDFAGDNQLITCRIDFGTMPVDGMFSLFDHLRLAGATRVELSMPQR